VVYGYSLHVPKDSRERDFNVEKQRIEYDQEKGGERILSDIDFVNKWLWFAL